MESTTSRMSDSGMPHRLSQTELAYVDSALDAELTAVKKCLQYGEMVTNDRARELFREFADTHHRRVDMMLALLECPHGHDITHQAKLLLQTNLQDQRGNHHA